jgi:hypothetical protein
VFFYSATPEFFGQHVAFPVRPSPSVCLLYLKTKKIKTGIETEHVFFSTDVMHIICMHRGRQSYSRPKVRRRARLAHAGPQERY